MLTATTIMSNKTDNIQQLDRALDVSISINESILRAIDAVRGDTNRSLWIRRLAIKELERQKNLHKAQETPGGKEEE